MKTKAYNIQLDKQNKLSDYIIKWWNKNDNTFKNRECFYSALASGINERFKVNIKLDIIYDDVFIRHEGVSNIYEKNDSNFRDFQAGLAGFISRIVYPESRVQKLERQLAVEKEMKTHYEDLFNVSLGELQFYKLQAEHYKALLDEVKVLVTDKLIKSVIKNGLERGELDKLIKSVIKNGLERGELDKLIHAKQLFKD